MKVFFLWNCQGKAAVDIVGYCILPDQYMPHHLLNGFWIDDSKPTYTKEGRQYEFIGVYGSSTMWVPPGRITSVTR